MSHEVAQERTSTVMRVAPLVTGVLTIAFAYSGTHADGRYTGPSTSDSADKVLAYFNAHTSGGGSGAFSLMLAAAFGLFFFGLLRERLVRSAPGEWLATVGYSGAVILAVAALIEAGIDFAFDDLGTDLTAPTAQILNILQGDLNQTLIIAGLAVLMVGFGLALRRSGPYRWLGWPTVVIGLLAIAGPLIDVAIRVEGLWIVLVGVLMLIDSSEGDGSTSASAAAKRANA